MTGSTDNTARLWNLKESDPTTSSRILRGHEGPIYTAAISTQGQWLVTGSWDNTARLWDAQTGLGISASLRAELIAWGQAELADESSLAAAHFGVEAIDTLRFPTAELEPTTRYLSTFGRVDHSRGD